MSEKVVFFKDCFPLIKLLSMENRGKVLTAGYLYSINGAEAKAEISELMADCDEYAAAIWEQIEKKMEYSLIREEEIAQKRKEAGKKGGLQKQANARTSKQLEANASKRKQSEAPCNTNTDTIPNNTHRLVNGKLYRTAEDGQRYYLDDGSPVGEGEV